MKCTFALKKWVNSRLLAKGTANALILWGHSPESNVVLIVGYQAKNTLGRRIVERRNPLKMLGEEIELKAQVEVINALSAHADRNGITNWLDEIKDNVRHAFAVHGETEKVEAMANLLKEHGIANAHAPHPGETFTID